MMIEREKEGKGFQFLPFYDRFRTVVRAVTNVYPDVVPEREYSGCYTMGRPLSMPSVRRTGRVSDGECGRWNREAGDRDDFRSCNVYSKDKCRTVSQNSIAVVDVWQTLTISTVRSMIPMRSAVRCKEACRVCDHDEGCTCRRINNSRGCVGER